MSVDLKQNLEKQILSHLRDNGTIENSIQFAKDLNVEHQVGCIAGNDSHVR